LGNQIVSPIANNALGYYRYKLEGVFYDDKGNLINKIKVTPKRDNDPVFSGYVYIVEDQWTFYALELDLTGTQARIPAADIISLQQDFSYSETDQIWAKISQTIDFKYGIFGIKGDGRFTYVYSNYDFNPEMTKKDFGREILSFEDEVMAGSRIERGCELNFGSLTRQLYSILETEFDTKVYCLHEVLDVDPESGTDWFVKVEDRVTKETQHFDAEHVFIGAGGGALLLLQKIEIEENDGYGGFPVSGEWLICKNENIVKQHNAKVYSKAGPDDPPMSTPHLDTRFIEGKRELLFGPFAGFSPKFLKEGSNFDLLKSIKFGNIKSMLGAFWNNLPLTKYLVDQVGMSHSDRMDELRKFVKNAKDEDWLPLVAGQRVQIIKKDAYEGGQLQFGTEVVSSKDGSITCLLGASPGASTSVHIMLEVLKKAFPEVLTSESGKKLLKEIVPAYNSQMTEELFKTQLKSSEAILKL
jgi:malate dehydrogenase (quinone)